MSYMRGDYYLWSDGKEVLHIWVADGYDGWDEAIWAADEGGKRHEERAKASGVGIPEKVMDEFVVMRLAQMVEENLVEDAIDRAIENYGGNFGMHLSGCRKSKNRVTASRIQEASVKHYPLIHLSQPPPLADQRESKRS